MGPHYEYFLSNRMHKALESKSTRVHYEHFVLKFVIHSKQISSTILTVCEIQNRHAHDSSGK